MRHPPALRKRDVTMMTTKVYGNRRSTRQM
jgi:hypothetical protein